MKIIFIANIILLAVAAIALTVGFVNLIKTEKELAKINESFMFKKNEEDKNE